MSFHGWTDPTAVEDEHGNAIVRFEGGDQIECQSMIEAEALAEAWRQWPFSGHRPVEESRSRWRTGFADGAAWAAARAGVVAEEPGRSPARPAANASDYPAGTRWMCEDSSIWETSWDAEDQQWIWAPVKQEGADDE